MRPDRRPTLVPSPAPPAGRSRRHLAALGIVALALAAGAGSAVASATPTPPPPYIAGWLALDTGAANTVTQYTSGGVGTGVQLLTTSTTCEMDQGGGGLLSFQGDPGAGVGLKAGAIGVRENTTANGTSCSAVDAASAETLTVSLGSTVRAQDLLGVSASLDIDLKQNAEILATATLGGAPAGTFTLQSGSRIVAADAGSPSVRQCNNPSDSGPDANTGNNCRWQINAVFDTLVLKAVAGSFSLMGGADGTVAGLPGYIGGSASVVELAQRTQVLTCGTASASVSGVNVNSSTWKNVGGSDCTPYPFFAEALTDAGRPAVHFVKPAWSGGQAEWTTQFAYSGKVPALQFAFDGTPPVFFAPGPCTIVSGAVVTKPDANGNYACILSTVVDKFAKTVTFQVYVLGDAWMRG